MRRTGWGVVCALLLPMVAGALPSPFPPGLEHDITVLVGDGALSNGCRANGIRIQSDFIDVRVECGAESGVVRLTSAEDSDAGALRRTTSFVVRLQEPATAPVRAAAVELAGQIAKRDDGTVLGKATNIRSSRTDQGDGAQARQLGLLDNLRRGLVWAGLVVLLTLLVATALRRARREDLAWVGFLVAVFAGALIVRLKLGYWAPIHANSHGIAELRGLVTSSSEWQGPVESDRYGVAYRQIVQAFLRLGHGRAHGAFLFAAVASALGVVPLALLGSALTSNRFVGVVAALGLAFHPLHIALSATESSFGLAGTLFLIGAACLCAVPSLPVQDRGRAWWAGALALAAACELSVITLVLPVAALVLAAAVLGKQDRRLWVWPLGILLVSMALHLDAVWPVLRQARELRGQEFLGTLQSFRGDRNALSNETLAAWTLRPLAIAGLLVLLVRRRWVGLTLLVATPLVIAVSASVNGCRTDVIRYQPIGHLLLFVLAASVLLVLPERGWALKAFGGALVALALLVPTRTAFAALRKPLLDVGAYRFVEKAVPPGTELMRVIVPPRRMGNRDVLSDFPDFVFLAAGHKVQVVEVGREKDEPPAQSCAVWVSQACFSFTGKEVEAGAVEKAVRLGAAPLRKECEPLVGQIDGTREAFLAAELPVPFREWEFLKVPAKPLVGLFPCVSDQKADATNAAVPAAPQR